MEKSSIINLGKTLSKDFIKFNNESPSPYHAVKETMNRLKSAGFTELQETETWIGKLANGGKYFTTRGGSSLVAWTCGQALNTDTTYFKIIGTHTDSPCVRLAPKSHLKTEEYFMAYIQTYGGGLWHTWLDRDLIVAGRVLVRDGQGNLSHRLYRSKSSIAKIADVCIHLRTDRESVKVNAETHLRAMFATSTFDDDSESKIDQSSVNHYRLFWEDVAKQVGCKVDDILDFDLCFADAQPSEIIGLNEEIISGPRLDNLFSSWSAITAITNLDVSKDDAINIAALFDHEEIGSETITGANSRRLIFTLRAASKLHAENLRGFGRRQEDGKFFDGLLPEIILH